tara:strand:- start:10699 stop:11262 length:564 start_codon:yes stop_codon:yes gene_type:complete
MREIIISFSVFVLCLSIALISQLSGNKVVEASTKINNPPVFIQEKTKSNNIFELDPNDSNPILFAMNEEPLNNETKTVTTISGLTLTDITIGEGEEAISGKTVSVNYVGKLESGEEFDSSYGRGPFNFPLGAGRVIKGWEEGVEGMKIGGKRKLIIPPELGYGARGAGNVIPPNATLIFEIELLDVK